ncbi:MAG: phosphoribosylformylglycinamidine synthase subunit PurQ [Leptospira sp.]|nr:phosphoribosylformylglycinamidine synthase subunit PurQ [Leptospira sp.]
MKVRVITFPGSNCDKDMGQVLQESFSAKVDYTWHRDGFSDLPDLVVLPGGFSFGDYLRCGAMAKFSVAMESVQSYAKKGGKVLGVCNGFQILTEAGLLPGALLHNRTLKYVCKDVDLVSDPKNPVVGNLPGKLTIPIAHGEGAYFADDATLDRLEENGQVAFRYKVNPNGSLRDIAGITNESGTILGMMPHPERALNSYTGKMDGKRILESILKK